MAAYVEIGGIQYPVVFDAPGEQSNLLQLTEITNPAGLQLYAVHEGDAVPDRKITWENLVQSLLPKADIRIGKAVACNGTSDQSINFESSMAGVPSILIVYDYENRGITRKSYTESGLVIDSLEAGLFDYLAIYIA
jgi:hypothetical protein